MTNSGKRQKKYTDKAMEVFKHDGLRLSLDELSGKMGITKKTLYNHFESKEILLCQCVMSMMDDMKMRIGEIMESSENPVFSLRNAFVEVDNYFSSLSPIFFYDMRKMYPEYACTEHATGFGFFNIYVLEYLKKGVSEGYFRDDIDVEMVSDYLSYTSFSYYFNKLIENNSSETKDFFSRIIEFNLRAMVSEKGSNVLKIK